MKTISNKSVLENIISNGNVCLKFSAEWCGPCRVMGDNIESIENEYPEINFIEVDVDDADEDILADYKVRNIPLIIFMKDGEILSKEVGVMSVEVLKEKIVECYGR